MKNPSHLKDERGSLTRYHLDSTADMSPLLHSAAVTGRPELAYQSMSQQVNEAPSWDGIKLLALHPLPVDSSLVDSLPVDPLTFN